MRWLIAWPLACVACAQGAIGDMQVEAGEEEASIDAATVAQSADSMVDTVSAFDSGADEQLGAADVVSAEDASAVDARGAPEASSADAFGTDAPAPAAARRVFVSGATFDGSLGGYAGADGTCQMLATGAGLGGTWMAWVSDATSSPSQRFSRAAAGYVLLDGTSVATSWTDLTTKGPTNAIDLTETGVSLAADSSDASKTWTGTLVSGAMATPSCSDFSSNASAQIGEVGHCTGTGTVNWTSAYADEACNVKNHLYCFEQ